MQMHAIVELEEGSLTVTVGTGDGRLLRTIRQPLADLGRETVTAALRNLGGDVFEGAPGVHVVLGERRMQHVVSTLPKMPANDVIGFVVREALRVTNMPSVEDLLVAPRLLRRLPGQRLVVGTTAISKAVWNPLQEAFTRAGIEVLSLHSMETCLALTAVSHGNQRCAVLEVNAGRARFVACDGGSPVQVRRFMIGGAGEGNSAALVAQLAMELPRTLEWLRETGHAQPDLLLLGTRLGIDEESMEMLRGDLAKVAHASHGFAVEPEQLEPGLAVGMLLKALVAGNPPPSLLAKPELVLPWPASRFVALATAAAAGLMCSWSAVIDGSAFLSLQDRLTEAAQESQRLAGELGQLQQAALESAPKESVDQERLNAALALRRPVSRLLGELSNCSGPALHLEEMKFASTERIVVTGVVEGQSRKAALAALADFSKKARALPFVLVDGQEEVNEVAGQQNRFRFRLSLAWRNS